MAKRARARPSTAQRSAVLSHIPHAYLPNIAKQYVYVCHQPSCHASPAPYVCLCGRDKKGKGKGKGRMSTKISFLQTLLAMWLTQPSDIHLQIQIHTFLTFYILEGGNGRFVETMYLWLLLRLGWWEVCTFLGEGSPGILFIGVACSVFTIYLVLRSVGSLVDNDITSLGGGC